MPVRSPQPEHQIAAIDCFPACVFKLLITTQEIAIHFAVSHPAQIVSESTIYLSLAKCIFVRIVKSVSKAKMLEGFGAVS